MSVIGPKLKSILLIATKLPDYYIFVYITVKTQKLLYK